MKRAGAVSPRPLKTLYQLPSFSIIPPISSRSKARSVMVLTVPIEDATSRTCMVGRLHDSVQVASIRLVRRRFRSLLEQLRKATDVAERRSEVVGDGVGEGLQLLVGFFELRGALPDSLLELLVEYANLFLGALALGYVAGDGRGSR